MPKRKTGARKKAHKQRLRQKEIRSGASTRSLADHSSNCVMVSANGRELEEKTALLRLFFSVGMRFLFQVGLELRSSAKM